MKKSLPPFFAYLAGVLPPILLYQHNADEITLLSDSSTVLVIVCVLCLISTLILRTIARRFFSKGKSELLVALFWVVFFSYGHFMEALAPHGLGRHRIVAPGILLGVALALYAITKLRNSKATILFFNRLSLILLCITIANYAYKKLKSYIPSEHGQSPQIAVKKDLPDVYLVILDGYANHNVLKQYYQFDNQEFRNSLAKMGFHILEDSRANYPFTHPSMAATLNMKYLNYLAKQERSTDMREYNKLLFDSEVVRQMKSMGYQFILLAPWMPLAEIKNYDLRFKCGEFQLLAPYTLMLVKTSLLSLIQSHMVLPSWNEQVRENVLCSFKKLVEIRALEGPKFVIAHIGSPHPPFVFGEKGEKIDSNEFDNPLMTENKDHTSVQPYYLAQLKYINQLAKKSLSELTQGSSEPVIILHSDHGPRFGYGWKTGDWGKPNADIIVERMKSLNAFLVPDKVKDKLYHSMSNVNTFRILFSEMYQLDYPILEDRSYFLKPFNPYHFREVTHHLTPRVAKISKKKNTP